MPWVFSSISQARDRSSPSLLSGIKTSRDMTSVFSRRRHAGPAFLFSQQHPAANQAPASDRQTETSKEVCGVSFFCKAYSLQRACSTKRSLEYVLPKKKKKPVLTYQKTCSVNPFRNRVVELRRRNNGELPARLQENPRSWVCPRDKACALPVVVNSAATCLNEKRYRIRCATLSLQKYIKLRPFSVNYIENCLKPLWFEQAAGTRKVRRRLRCMLAAACVNHNIF